MRFPVALLLWTGTGVIIVGLVLMFKHLSLEEQFQNHMLEKFGPDYHWRSVGDTYAAISTIIVGALMMAVAALARR